jgi:hypothetical protein
MIMVVVFMWAFWRMVVTTTRHDGRARMLARHKRVESPGGPDHAKPGAEADSDLDVSVENPFAPSSLKGPAGVQVPAAEQRASTQPHADSGLLRVKSWKRLSLTVPLPVAAPVTKPSEASAAIEFVDNPMVQVADTGR